MGRKEQMIALCQKEGTIRMKECGKLFKRDRIYLLCTAVVVVFAFLYVMAGCCRSVEFAVMQGEGYDISQYRESADMLLRLWGDTDPGNIYSNGMRAVFFIVAAAQIARWYIMERKHGREFQKLLPVKGRSFVTYDLICGILFVWLPVIISRPLMNDWMKGLDYNADYSVWVSDRICSLFIVNTFVYVLLVFSKRIANHIPGAVFFAFIIWFGLYCIQAYTGKTVFFGEDLPPGSPGAIVLLTMTVICIILSYLCDKRRDISGSGLFSFKTAHYLILGIMLAELATVFIGIFSSTAMGKAAGAVIGVLLSGAVAFGVHYVAKPGRA